MRSRAASMSWNVITRCPIYRARNSGNVFTSITKNRRATRPTCGPRPLDAKRVCLQSVRRARRGERLRFVERFAHFGSELLGIERFRQEKHAGISAIARLERFLEVPGNENHLYVRAGRAQPIGEAGAAHLLHVEVVELGVSFS